MKTRTRLIKKISNWGLYRYYSHDLDCFGKGYMVIYEGKHIPTHSIDYPIRYNEGGIAWDYPEALPAYLKKEVKKLI